MGTFIYIADRSHISAVCGGPTYFENELPVEVVSPSF
jgi:hypothetical protein